MGNFKIATLKIQRNALKTRCFTYQNKAELTRISNIHISPSVIAMERRKSRKTNIAQNPPKKTNPIISVKSTLLATLEVTSVRYGNKYACARRAIQSEMCYTWRVGVKSMILIQCDWLQTSIQNPITLFVICGAVQLWFCKGSFQDNLPLIDDVR